MNDKVNRLPFILLVLANMFVGLTACVIMFFVSVWMIGDDAYPAEKMNDQFWLNVALSRAFQGFIIAAVFFWVLGFINRFYFKRWFPDRKPLNWLIAGAVGILVAMTVVAACIIFYRDQVVM